MVGRYVDEMGRATKKVSPAKARGVVYGMAHRAALIAQSFYWHGKWVEEER